MKLVDLKKTSGFEMFRLSLKKSSLSHIWAKEVCGAGQILHRHANSTQKEPHSNQDSNWGSSCCEVTVLVTTPPRCPAEYAAIKP